MRYTVKQFRQDFPNDDVCLDTIFENRFGEVKQCPNPDCFKDTKFHRVAGRKCYACQWCGYQLHPLAQTIFHKSSTPLVDWFYAIYLFSVSKNGVAAKELERHLGVTYKTAHRMAKQIRSLMSEDGQIGGTGFTVEADETYFGKRNKTGIGPRVPKSAIMGAVERDGELRTQVVPKTNGKVVHRFIMDNVKTGTDFQTDESALYKWANKAMDLSHTTVNHSKLEYVRGDAYTNTIEGFWSQLKRSIDGTYHAVSPKYLQLYVDEFAYRYNLRGAAVYPDLLERAWTRV